MILACQLIGNYYATSFLEYNGFLWLWVILRIIIPCITFISIGIPLKKLYIKTPVFDIKSIKLLLVISFVLILLFIYLNWFSDSYLAYYRNGQTLVYLRVIGRFKRFLFFTLSTTIGWEILHRSFLLGGLQQTLTNNMKVPKQSSTVISIMMVCVFEALFHITKPIYESIPMIVASIALSVLTIRTKSVWPALFVHLAIELIFGHAAYVGFL